MPNFQMKATRDNGAEMYFGVFAWDKVEAVRKSLRMLPNGFSVRVRFIPEPTGSKRFRDRPVFD